MYTQLLCGLHEHEQVNRIGSAFASGLIRTIKFLELSWQDLAHDIRFGSLSPEITDDALRECMGQIMNPNPELADLVTNVCSRENWEGIIPRIWANAKCLQTVITGSMAHCASLLDYYSGGLPIACTTYASSECCFGINLDPLSKPEDISYTLIPNLAFFEFIPQEPYMAENGTTDTINPKFINLVDVKIGMEYEVIITTYTGLYRYRVGDILTIIGFHDSAPKFKFLRRKGVLLSIEADNTDETELKNAIENASQILQSYKIGLVDYTSHANKRATPGHYIMYLELSMRDLEHNSTPSNEVLELCCVEIEESFNVYQHHRKNKVIGPLEIRVVKNGTFQDLMDLALSKGASVGQCKVPRCFEVGPMLDLLDARVVCSHSSPCVPSHPAEESKE